MEQYISEKRNESYRILIVEDEKGIARAIGEQVKTWGIESKVCGKFPGCDGGISYISAASGADGYHASFF